MRQPDEWARQAQRALAQGRTPHFAPQPEALALHRRHLDQQREASGRAPAVLVLGATPELADLALEAGCEVLRVDCNAAMLEAARPRQRVADRRRETVVLGDWLALDFQPPASIDLVLGDSALNNVPHAQMPALGTQLARVLRPGGSLSLRQIVLPDDLSPFDPRRVVAAWRAGQASEREAYTALRFGSFLAAGHDPAQHTLDAARIFAAMDAFHAQGGLTPAELAFLDSRRSHVVHTVYTLRQQVDLLSQLGRCEVHACGIAPLVDAVFKVFRVTRP